MDKEEQGEQSKGLSSYIAEFLASLIIFVPTALFAIVGISSYRECEKGKFDLFCGETMSLSSIVVNLASIAIAVLFFVITLRSFSELKDYLRD